MVCAFALSGLAARIPQYADRSTLEPLTLQPLEFISKSEIATVLDQIENALLLLDYERGRGSRTVERIRATWHRLFKRSGLLESEAQMFRGFTRRIREKIK